MQLTGDFLQCILHVNNTCNLFAESDISFMIGGVNVKPTSTKDPVIFTPPPNSTKDPVMFTPPIVTTIVLTHEYSEIY